MKNIKYKVVILFLLCISTFAQKKGKQLPSQENSFYVALQTGYQFATGNTQTFNGYNNSTIETSNTNATYKTNILSLGKGINFGLNLGYNFNQHVAFELGVGYLKGATTTFKDTDFDGDYIEYGYQSKFVQIKPTIVLSGGFSKINPYVKFGLQVNSGSFDRIATRKTGSNILNIIQTFSGGLSIGFSGGLGVNYTLNDKISLFGEFSFLTMKYNPEKAVLTKSDNNGVDQLPTITTSQKEISFVDSFDTSAVLNPNEPTKQNKLSYPLNSYGFSIGVKYGF